MSQVRQIGIKMVVDAQSVTTEVPRAAREFDNLASRAEQGAARTTRSLAQVSMSVRDIIQGAAGLHVVGAALSKISEAIVALPRNAFNYAKELEVSQVGMAGILGSMTAINGQQTQYNQALQISSEYIRKLNDDALRTAATSQELTPVFQALLAPGLGAKMTLEEIRQLTVVGTNAVKSMGLEAGQVVQELRDLVAGGITPASSTLATALGLKDSDIAAAKASSEGLFKFLMDRLQGFQASSEAFGDTFKGKLEQVKEGATRVAAEGFEPMITASKAALDEIAKLFVTIEGGDVKLNQGLIDSIREVSEIAVRGITAASEFAGVLWDNRDAVLALVTAWASYKVGDIVSSTVAATAAKIEAAQASRLLTIQQAAETAGNAEVAVSSKAKIAAYLAELQANVARAQGEVAAQAVQIATLRTTEQAIVVARADVVAKMDSTRATMAQAEAQLVAARAAGAQSFALAMVREATQTLTAAQARHALLMTELATLGKQQAGVQAAVTAATAAQTAAQDAAAVSAARLSAAQGAASITGRALSGVVGFLGGPIGILTTAVTLGATAWALWGNAGSSAEAKVQGALERSTPEIIADLDKQIGKLRERNALVAAGLGDIAKQGGAAADKLGQLQVQIDNLKAGKGIDGGAPLPEPARVAVLQSLMKQYGELYGKVNQFNEAQNNTKAGAAQLTLTLNGTEQAWRKSIDGVKTAISIQSEYDQKLKNSRAKFADYEKLARAQPNFDAAKFREDQTEQAQAEKALADERDKQIKALHGGAAAARSQGIDAEIASTKHGYKLLAAQTADSLAEVESLHKRGVISDSDALERRTALQLADIDAQRQALQSELGLLKGRKDSAKKQADVNGELAELDQKRANIEAAAARQQRELDAEAADALQKRIEGYQANARQVQENVRVARLDQAEIGKTGEELGKLRQARVEDAAAQLEAQARTMDGIDLSGAAGKALREQAQATRELAKVQGYNESARMVADYARSVREANEATQYELSLSAMSQRDREIALEQYRIAVDLKHKLEEIDARNPADASAAARLKADAEATAVQAKAGAAARVYAREMTRSVDQMNDVFRKGFSDMVTEGEQTWTAFTKSVRTNFKTVVADELYKAFAQPLVIPVIASLQGLIGSIGTSLGLGGSGNLLGMAGNASSLYSAVSGNSLLGNAASTIGGWLGLGGSAAATGLGLSAASAGASAIGAGIGTGLGMGLGTTAASTGLSLGAGAAGLGMTAGSAGAGAIGAGLGASAAATGATAGAAAGASAAGSIMGTIGAAAPYLGAAVALASLLGGSFGGESRTGGQYGVAFDGRVVNQRRGETYTNDGQGYKNLGAAGNALVDGQAYRMEGVESYATEDAIKTAVSSTASSINTLLKGLGSKATLTGFWAGLETSERDRGGVMAGGSLSTGGKFGESGQGDNYAGTLYEKWSTQNPDFETAVKEFNLDLKQSMLQALQAAGDIPKSVASQLAGLNIETMAEDAVDALLTKINTLVAASQQLGTAFETMGLAFPEDQLIDMTAAMSTASGGTDALNSNLTAFYESFYTEAERMQALQQQVLAQVDALGIAIDTSTAETASASFKAAVQQAIGAGNGELAAQLLALGKSFQTAADYAAKGAETVLKSAQALRTSLVNLEGKFSEGGFARQYRAEDAARTLSQLLATVGVDRSVDQLAANILNATAGEVEQYFREVWSLLDTTEARQQLVSVTDAILDLGQAAGSLAETTSDMARAFAESASAALTARNSAGSLLDRINGELGGNSSAFALQREQELWAAMATASYEQQIDLAGQLTDSVLGRMALEKQSAEKLTALHKSLRDSIEATRVGTLSPLTLGQKLKEAGDHFYDAVAKANAGDTEAAGQLVNLRQTYLELAQRYYAASDDYTAVFNASENALTGLAGQMQTEAQQQLAASQGAVSELQRLRDITQAAYDQADRDYVTSSAALQEQAQLLTSMDGGIALVGDIIKGLPAELAALLQPLMGAGGSDAALVALMRGAQDANPALMLRDLQSMGLASGASATQVARVSGQLYSDADVAALLAAGRQNYPTWSTDQLAALGQSQYGISREQLDRVINGSHANGLERVPFDGYVAKLHRDELVMPSRQAELFRSMDFSGMGRGIDAMAAQMQAVYAELRQARQQSAELFLMLAQALETTSGRTAQELRQAVRETALAGAKPR